MRKSWPISTGQNRIQTGTSDENFQKYGVLAVTRARYVAGTRRTQVSWFNVLMNSVSPLSTSRRIFHLQVAGKTVRRRAVREICLAAEIRNIRVETRSAFLICYLHFSAGRMYEVLTEFTASRKSNNVL